MIYLLDTNAISDLMRQNPQITARLGAAAASDRVVTSVIVRGEILHGLLRMPAGKRKDSLQLKADPCSPRFPAKVSRNPRPLTTPRSRRHNKRSDCPWTKTTCGSLRPHRPPAAPSSAETRTCTGS